SVGATTVVGRALIRDLFEGAAAQRQFARVNLVFTLAPIVAPMLGGYLLTVAGWRSIFWFLVAYPLVLLAATWRWLPETLPRQGRRPLQLVRIVGNVATFASSPRFSALAWMAAGSFCGFFAYFVGRAGVVRGVRAFAPPSLGWLFPRPRGWNDAGLMGGRPARRHEDAVRHNSPGTIAFGRRSARQCGLPRGVLAGCPLERASAHALLPGLRAHPAKCYAAHARHVTPPEGSHVVAAKLRADVLRHADLGTDR